MARAERQTAILRGVADSFTPLLRRLAFWVGLPFLLALIYFGFLATDMYQSESKYTIQGTGVRVGGNLDSLFGALPVGAGTGEHDARAVQEYILSRDVLRRLDSEQGFIKHHQDPDIDWITRIPVNATFEEAFEYYKGLVDVRYDNQSGVSTLTVLATTAEDAQRFAHAILRYAEGMVNELSERARLDSMEFSRIEVEEGERRLAKARQSILDLQREGKEIDPKESASAVFNIRSQLDTELSMARAELSQLESFMQPEAHQVQTLRHKIESLEEQVGRENLKLVASETDSLSASIARFEPRVLEKEFAEKAYASALASLEIARAEAAQQHRYLATIVTPSVPDEPTHPERILGILTVFSMALAGFGIVTLMIAAVREHSRL